jgi:hypothetical protein
VRIYRLLLVRIRLTFLGGGCWGATGLIGINLGVTSMSRTYPDSDSGIAEAAIYSPKNIISTSNYFHAALMVFFIREIVYFIKSIQHEIGNEEIKEKNENKSPPSKKPNFPVVDFTIGC